MTARARGGVTLVELLVTLALSGVVLAAAFGTVVRQGRAYADVVARVRARATLRDAADVIDAELRWAAPADLRVATDTLVELAAYQGAAIVCTRPSAFVAALPAEGTAVSMWRSPPRAGDELAFTTSAPSGASVERRAAVVDVSRDAAGCVGSAFGAGAGAFLVTLSDSAPVAGTAVVTLRATQLRYYASVDGMALGVSEREGAGWGSVQPATGSFADATSDAGRGFRLRFVDAVGAESPALADVRAVAIAAQAATSGYAATRVAGASVVALRNGRTR